MVFVFVLVAAIIFLCLWGMVKMGSESDEQLMDYFAAEENRSRGDVVNNGGMFEVPPLNINNFATEYSEEFVDEIENIGEDVFNELPDESSGDELEDETGEEFYGADNYNETWRK